MAKFIYNKYAINRVYSWDRYTTVENRVYSIIRTANSQHTVEIYHGGLYSGYYIDQSAGRIVLTGYGASGGLSRYYAQVGSMIIEYNSSGQSIYQLGISAPQINKTKGSFLNVVTGTTSSAYPSDGVSGSYWYVSKGYTNARGSFIETVEAEEGTYPNDGIKDNYWYVRGDLANRGPTISGSDLDLGAKVSNFQIEYIVTDPDAGDAVTVEIKVNNTITQPHTATSLGVKRFVNVDITEYALGKHTVTITAKDKAGLTATRIYTFTKTNTAPEISGIDTDLGAKNTPFTVTYQVKDRDGDQVTVYEKLNGTVINTLTNVALETDLTVTIAEATLQTFEIGKTQTIEIEARDNKGGIAYRRFTFRRTNFPPIISGTDGELGEFETEFNYEWSATDVEGDTMKASIFFDGMNIKLEHEIVDNEQYTIKFEGFEFLKIKPGKHSVRISVVDDKGGKSERTVSFTRVARRLIMQQQDVYETDVAAQRILVVPNSRVALGAVEKIEVTNNGFDANPTWEDATAMVKAGKAYNFQNTAKTAAEFGIDTRLQIDREDAPALQSWIAGWGLSYE